MLLKRKHQKKFHFYSNITNNRQFKFNSLHKDNILSYKMVYISMEFTRKTEANKWLKIDHAIKHHKVSVRHDYVKAEKRNKKEEGEGV